MATFTNIACTFLILSLIGCTTAPTNHKGNDASATSIQHEVQIDNWLKDLASIKQTIADTYPNLELQVARKKLKLKTLGDLTTEQVRQSKSDKEAFSILQNFVRKFDDPHLKLVANSSASATQDIIEIKSKIQPIEACRSMGFTQKSKDFLFQKDDHFSSNLDSISPFSYGTYRTSNSNYGILRIHSFSPKHYLEICIEEWPKYSKQFGELCNDSCQDKFVHEILENRLILEVEKIIRDLNERKVNELVLDLTHNGGGSSWVEAVMQIITSKKLFCGKKGYVKNSHSVEHFNETINDLKEKSRSESDSIARMKLQTLIQSELRNLEEITKKCDRNNIWQTDELKVDCEILVNVDAKECGVNDEYKFHKGLFTGKVYALADNYTSSASEDLLARIKDNHVGVVLGELTNGAGCGYTNGGIKIELPYSKGRLRVPDCVRYYDGNRNEILGIAPDIVLDLSQINKLPFLKELFTEIEATKRQ